MSSATLSVCEPGKLTRSIARHKRYQNKKKGRSPKVVECRHHDNGDAINNNVNNGRSSGEHGDRTPTSREREGNQNPSYVHSDAHVHIHHHNHYRKQDDESRQRTRMKVSEALCKPSDEVKQLLEGLYECSPWVADKFVKERTAQSQGKGDDGAATAPITTVTGLAKALKSIVDDSTQDEKMLLIRSHPDLCEKVSEMANLSEESQDEQSRAGLQSLTVQEFADFERNNAAYKRKFEFPFILAVRNATKYTVLSAMAGRLENSAQQEFAIAMQQVHKIAWMRILAKFESDQPAGFLTCHVLDTANGCPARNMRIQLHRLSPPESAGLVGEFVTNSDGRLDGGPALKGSDFQVGSYEWTFYAADYFASRGTFTSGTPFLDVIPIRFGIDNPDDHYHVPLLVSPWNFSTYRGS